jgi:hypothetical protein
MMTPPVIPPTKDNRWTVRAIAKALDKPALEIVGDTVRPEDWHCRPHYEHSFREAGPVPPGAEDKMNTPRMHKRTRDEFLSQYREFNTEHWGERCPDAEPGCPVCMAWALYDAVAMTLVVDDG